MNLVFRNIIAVFGLFTLFLSGSVLFDLFGFSEKAGNYVPFIVWVNFICSFCYLIIAYFYFSLRKWLGLLFVFAAIVLILALIGLRFYSSFGEVFDPKIIGALYFRIYLTLILSMVAYKITENKSKINTT